MSKNQEVLITLKSIQSNGNEKSETEIITSGKYQKIPEGFKICYEESEATGFEGCQTILTTKGEFEVNLLRKGDAMSNLTIEKGKKHHCHYGTPYGNIMVGIAASDIRSELDSKGGDLYFKYVVDVNSTFVSENEIYINVKKGE